MEKNNKFNKNFMKKRKNQRNFFQKNNNYKPLSIRDKKPSSQILTPKYLPQPIKKSFFHKLKE